MSNNLPVFKIQDKNLSCSVFKFTSNDGKDNYSISFQRSYKKKDSPDYVREEIHCYDEDLLKISNICEVVYNKILSLRTKRTQEKTVINDKPTDDCPF